VPKFAPIAIQARDPMKIEPNKVAYLQRPDFRLGYDRYLLFDYDENGLESRILYDQFMDRYPKYIGALGGSQVYIAQLEGALHGYNNLEWNFWYPIILGKKTGRVTKYLLAQGAKYVKRPFQTIRATLSTTIEQAMRLRLSYFWDTPYKDKEATVRIGNELSSGEKQALAQRRLHSAVQLDKKFGTAAYIPKIALLTSGGGFRSMFLTLGFLAAAQQNGLLDMITWTGSVSGSAWAVGTLLSYVMHQKNTNIADFNESFTRALNNKKMTPTFAEIQAINNLFLVHALEHQSFTTIDLFGALLANRLLYFVPIDERQRVYMSQQASLIETGAWPIPIYTAVQYDAALPPEQYRWVECNPWEIGGTWLGCYAPIWATGRQFSQGVSQDYHLEKSLGYLFGTFGSAFAERVSKAYEQFKDSFGDFTKKIIESVIVEQLGEQRLWWAQLYNFTQGLSVSPIKDQEYLDLIDAAFANNVPYPPFSGERTERTPDILIILDNSTINDALVLTLMKKYAKRHNLKLPPISHIRVTKQVISVFKDINDPSVPVIIYMPRLIDPSLLPKLKEPAFKQYAQWIENFNLEKCIKDGVCAIFNMVYPYTESMRLMKLAEFNLMANQQIIFDEIKEVIDRKKAPVVQK
jgi:hypothetical protein